MAFYFCLTENEILKPFNFVTENEILKPFTFVTENEILRPFTFVLLKMKYYSLLLLYKNKRP
jgi:hypothetical protein